MASDKIADAAAPSGQVAVDDKMERDYYAQDHKHRVIQGAKLATENEQNMTLLQGIRLYPKAIAWSMLISTCIVMEGYDVCLINNFCEHLRVPLPHELVPRPDSE